jgi:hypothetical protein
MRGTAKPRQCCGRLRVVKLCRRRNSTSGPCRRPKRRQGGQCREYLRIQEIGVDGLQRCSFIGVVLITEGWRGIAEPMRRYRAGSKDAEGERDFKRVDLDAEALRGKAPGSCSQT